MKKKTEINFRQAEFTIHINVDGFAQEDKNKLKEALSNYDYTTEARFANVVNVVEDEKYILAVEFEIDNKQHLEHRINDVERVIEKILKVYKYRTVTEEEGREIYEESKQWFEKAPSTSMFNDAKGIAMGAVAEYLANQKNLTLYKL